MQTLRIVVKTTDIETFYGIHNRNAGKMISQVKKALKLKRKDIITVHQFADFHNIEYEPLLNAMNSKNIDEYIKKTKAIKKQGLSQMGCSDVPNFENIDICKNPIIK